MDRVKKLVSDHRAEIRTYKTGTDEEYNELTVLIEEYMELEDDLSVRCTLPCLFSLLLSSPSL